LQATRQDKQLLANTDSFLADVARLPTLERVMHAYYCTLELAFLWLP